MINKTPPQKDFNMITGLIILLIVCILVFVGWYAWQSNKSAITIDTFEACAAAGNPVMETYPEQCSAGGKTFTKSR